MGSRRGRARPRSTPPELDGQGIFSGLILYLSTTPGPDFTTARRALLAKNIIKNGGEVAESLSNEVSHIIQSIQVQPKDIIGADPNNIYTPEWVVEALKEKKLPDPGRHRWRPPTPPPEALDIQRPESPTPSPASEPLSPRDSSPDEPASVTKKDLNPIVTDVLDKLASAENALGNFYEGIAYERARNIVRALREPLRTESDVDRLLSGRKGIGTKLLSRIKEVVRTGGSEKLDNLESDERVRAIAAFMQIWGVGQKLANELYQKGCRTLDDVRKIQTQLPSAVQKSLRVHEELQVKMPREEVRKLADVVETTLHNRFLKTVLTVCGSYRRSELMCGDIDMIINPTGESDSKHRYEILSRLISDLTATGFLTDHLALPSPHKGEEDHYSYMGIAQLTPDSLHRRIDIKIYPEEMMPFALAYFTGDSQFVRKMRLHARHMGYSLSDHGLEPVSRGPEGKQILGPSLPCPTEKDIFKHLGIVWVEPEDRANATVELVDEQPKHQSKSMTQFESSQEPQTTESKKRKIYHKAND